MSEIPKGLRLILQMAGITPEMLANPVNLLKQFGINPDDITKEVAAFRQIGVRIEQAFIQCSTRLARIEAHLGIAPDHAGTGGGADAENASELGSVDQLPPHRRN